MKYLHGIVIENDKPKNYKIVYEKDDIQLRHHIDTGEYVIKIGREVKIIPKEFVDKIKKHSGLVQTITEEILH